MAKREGFLASEMTSQVTYSQGSKARGQPVEGMVGPCPGDCGQCPPWCLTSPLPASPALAPEGAPAPQPLPRGGISGRRS